MYLGNDLHTNILNNDRHRTLAKIFEIIKNIWNIFKLFQKYLVIVVSCCVCVEYYKLMDNRIIWHVIQHLAWLLIHNIEVNTKYLSRHNNRRLWETTNDFLQFKNIHNFQKLKNEVLVIDFVYIYNHSILLSLNICCVCPV